MEVWSQCGGVAGGLVVPWYPQPSLSNATKSPLTLTLSLLAPPPTEQATHPPHLLLWSSSECELELSVTSDPLVLLDKLAILHSPVLLPWVTGLCISASSRWIKLEILMIVLLQAIISTRYSKHQSGHRPLNMRHFEVARIRLKVAHFRCRGPHSMCYVEVMLG